MMQVRKPKSNMKEPKKTLRRGSGVILPVFSLPGSYGIGTLGRRAYDFIDFLEKAGLRYWQILPLGPTGYGDSPYQSFSSFAGNPYHVDLNLLLRGGLLSMEDLEAVDFGHDPERVDYSKLYDNRLKVLRKAYEKGMPRFEKEVEKFYADNRSWLRDYALYMTIKSKLSNAPWMDWPAALRDRKKKTIAAWEIEEREEIYFHVFIQYLFYRQWKELKDYAKDHGVSIIGDMPIYIALDSADAWANGKMLKLDAEKKPLVVAGVPPDDYAEEGQLWGNPIYDWDYLARRDFDFWMERIGNALKLYDVLRFDHFRGFESYWEVPYGEATAKNGTWAKGPGLSFFKKTKEKLGDIPIILEDLGFITPEVRRLKEKVGYPGLKVMQFAFGSEEDSEYRPHNFEGNTVSYTSTHDSDTLKGWLEGLDEETRQRVRDYFHIHPEQNETWSIIRGNMASTARIAISQMQDFLELGVEARTNVPGTLGDNWRWRMKEGVLTEELAQKIHRLNKLYGRI